MLHSSSWNVGMWGQHGVPGSDSFGRLNLPPKLRTEQHLSSQVESDSWAGPPD